MGAPLDVITPQEWFIWTVFIFLQENGEIAESLALGCAPGLKRYLEEEGSCFTAWIRWSERVHFGDATRGRPNSTPPPHIKSQVAIYLKHTFDPGALIDSKDWKGPPFGRCLQPCGGGPLFGPWLSQKLGPRVRGVTSLCGICAAHADRNRRTARAPGAVSFFCWFPPYCVCLSTPRKKTSNNQQYMSISSKQKWILFEGLKEFYFSLGIIWDEPSS